MVDWSMYAEIQRLKNKGFKKAQTARQLGLNRETVTKYWDMPPDEYGGLTKKHRTRKADVYQELIIEWLTVFFAKRACKKHLGK